MPAPTYHRVTFRTSHDTQRTVWARNFEYTLNMSGCWKFWVVDKNGDASDPKELVYCAPEDLIKKTPARMNLHYAELEIVR